MINETHASGRVVKAALELAAEHPWQDIALRDIADRADVPLAELRNDFSGKPAILGKFMRLVDDTVLARRPARDEGQSARDRLFDVLMTRLEVLEPYKAAIRSIAKAPGTQLSLAPRAMASQAWMLHAAGISTDGPVGRARVAGLVSIYANLLKAWLDEDDPAYPRTMAALDRSLKRGEGVLQSLNDAQSFACRIAKIFRPSKPAKKSGDTPPQPQAREEPPSVHV